jgi:hypothetical protein
LTQNTGHVRTLINRFNAMLRDVGAAPEFAHVHYLDLRGTLAASPYKNYWANELHPTGRGFSMVTARFARLISSL